MRILAPRSACALAALLVASGSHAVAQQPTTSAYTPSPENAAARVWYQNAKLGMFILWGPSSVKQDSVFVHVLYRVDAVLSMPRLPRRVLRASLLDGGAPVPVTTTASGITLTLPRRDVSAADQVVVLTLGR